MFRALGLESFLGFRAIGFEALGFRASLGGTSAWSRKVKHGSQHNKHGLFSGQPCSNSLGHIAAIAQVRMQSFLHVLQPKSQTQTTGPQAATQPSNMKTVHGMKCDKVMRIFSQCRRI